MVNPAQLPGQPTIWGKKDGCKLYQPELFSAVATCLYRFSETSLTAKIAKNRGKDAKNGKISS
jgi:hypothetical protein